MIDIFYLHTKFGSTHFSRSGDMIVGIEIENGSCDPDHASFRGSLSSVYKIDQYNFNRSRNMVGSHQNLNGSRDLAMPLSSII